MVDNISSIDQSTTQATQNSMSGACKTGNHDKCYFGKCIVKGFLCLCTCHTEEVEKELTHARCKIQKFGEKIAKSSRKGSSVYLTPEEKGLILDAYNHYSEGDYYFDSCNCEKCSYLKKEVKES